MSAQRANADVGHMEALYRLVGIIRHGDLRERGPYSVWVTPFGGQPNALGKGAETYAHYAAYVVQNHATGDLLKVPRSPAVGNSALGW